MKKMWRKNKLKGQVNMYAFQLSKGGNIFVERSCLLLQVQHRQGIKGSPLRQVQEVHPPHGPPLSLGGQLRRQTQP